MANIPMATKFTRTVRAALRGRWPRLVLLFVAAGVMAGGAQQKSVVRALLFFSPTCAHCHDVMDNHLPPLVARHGDALRIVAVNVQTPDGQALYQRVALHFALPNERLGVPALVVGDRVLVGSGEIPAELPRIVETGLAAGGIDWPAVDAVAGFLRVNGLLEEKPVDPRPGAATAALAEQNVVSKPAATTPAGPAPAEPLPAEVAPQAVAESPPGAGTAADAPSGLVLVGSDDSAAGAAGPWQKFARDPVGNSISVLVLLGMMVVAMLAVRGVALRDGAYGVMPRWAVPMLTTIGVGVAAYMSFVEVTHAEAVCGPVGDCNAVQSSPYAAILGIPIGVLGLLGYAALGAGWFWVSRAGERTRGRGAVLLWSAALGGVLFSIYLTFLEPFVIGATCVWCLGSAVVMTLILMALTPGAATARPAPHRTVRS